MRAITRAASILVLGTGVLLGGCATKESVEQAQATADQAKGDAASARSAADRAQTSADGAAKTAQDALALAQQANDKVDKVIADLEAAKANHGRHHRRHTAALRHSQTAQAACPPTEQQKSELQQYKNRQAANVSKKGAQSSPVTTARN